jgi:predicted N-acetyltransferase YhbS
MMNTVDLSYQIRPQSLHDEQDIHRLMGLGFAPSHSGRAIWKLRQSQPVGHLSLVADAGDHLLGSIRYWPIMVGGRPSILLGPLAVDPNVRGMGIGVALVQESLNLANKGDWEWCFISGEPNYYLKFGFQPVSYDDISLHDWIEPERLHLLALSQAKPDIMPAKPWPVVPSVYEAGDHQQAEDVS